MAKKHWIQSAIKHPGALKAAAAKAGKTVSAFCASPNLSGVNKRRCALAKTLRSMHK